MKNIYWIKAPRPASKYPQNFNKNSGFLITRSFQQGFENQKRHLDNDNKVNPEIQRTIYTVVQ